jgi:hypothetical protein
MNNKHAHTYIHASTSADKRVLVQFTTILLNLTFAAIEHLVSRLKVTARYAIQSKAADYTNDEGDDDANDLIAQSTPHDSLLDDGHSEGQG